MTTPDPAALKAAPRSTLDARAKTDQVKALVDELVGRMRAWESTSGARKYGRGAESLEVLKVAAGAFLADLLRDEPDAHGWVSRPLGHKTFAGQAITYPIFMALRDALVGLELVETAAGFPKFASFDPGEVFVAAGGGKVTRFRATAVLLSLCAAHDITRNNAGDHFQWPLPTDVLRKRAHRPNVGGIKHDGKRMTFEHTETTRGLEGFVHALNEFIAKHDVRGGMHRGFQRTFNEGDVPGFNWNRGGRLYSLGWDSYQQIDRDRRLQMTIDGEAVVEIDIRASYLTILHAVHHVPLKVSATDHPYEATSWPRSVVKTFCVAYLGGKKRPKKWPLESVRKFALENPGHPGLESYSLTQVMKDVFKAMPLLERWPQLPGTWADLMFAEAQAVVEAITSLMRTGVVALPVHDSIIVPANNETIAAQVLSSSYQHFCGVRPYLSIHRKRL